LILILVIILREILLLSFRPRRKSKIDHQTLSARGGIIKTCRETFPPGAERQICLTRDFRPGRNHKNGHRGLSAHGGKINQEKQTSYFNTECELLLFQMQIYKFVFN